MKNLLKLVLSAFSAVALTITVLAAPAQAVDRTFEFDCSVLMVDPGNWQPEISVNPGDNLTINFTNCADTAGFGGTSGGYFFGASSGTGGVTFTDTSDPGTPRFEFEIDGTGTGSLIGRVVTNLNETYDLDMAAGEGSFLFVIGNEGGDYLPVIKLVGESGSLAAGDVLGKVKFGPNSALLTASAKKKLRAIANDAIDAGANTLQAKGFTAVGVDKSWSEAQRVALAKNRSTAVKSFLVSVFEKKNADINVTIRAVGSKNPVKPNTNESNRAKNRRVEVVFID